jgi:RHS repeat-associated protein
MTERFYSVNGQMMGYESGGVKKDFLTDHLGSITAEIDQNQNRTFETRYSAYGRNNWSTGTGCGFGWVGSYGYRETGLFHSSHYVRARHYSYLTGNWSTVDPLWPNERAFLYVLERPTKVIDPTGKGCWLDGPPVYVPPDDCLAKGMGRTEPSRVWDPNPNKRECFGGCFSNCLCDVAIATQPLFDKPKQPGKNNAIAHCTTACAIEAICGPSGSKEWDSRELGLKCLVTPWACRGDSRNNGVGAGFGRGLARPIQYPGGAGPTCLAKCKKAWESGLLDGNN